MDQQIQPSEQSLVILDNNVPLADSREIARQLNIEPRSFFRMIVEYQNEIEEDFGSVRFQITPKTGAKAKAGGDQPKYALLTEDQSYAYLAYSQNTEESRRCKRKLVKNFATARHLIKTHIPELAEGIAKWPQSMNRFLDMNEEQKLKELEKITEELRNLSYSVQAKELHLHMKLLCIHAFGILNNWNAPLEESDKLLEELFQMRLKLQIEHTCHFSYAEIERKIRAWVEKHAYPAVFHFK